MSLEQAIGAKKTRQARPRSWIELRTHTNPELRAVTRCPSPTHFCDLALTLEKRRRISLMLDFTCQLTNHSERNQGSPKIGPWGHSCPKPAEAEMCREQMRAAR